MSSRNAPPMCKQAVKHANISKRREHRRSWQNEIHFISTPVYKYNNNESADLCAPMPLLHWSTVSVTSTDLLLSLVWKPQIMTANNFLKRQNCFLLSSHGRQKGSSGTCAFLVMMKEFNFIRLCFCCALFVEFLLNVGQVYIVQFNVAFTYT